MVDRRWKFVGVGLFFVLGSECTLTCHSRLADCFRLVHTQNQFSSLFLVLAWQKKFFFRNRISFSHVLAIFLRRFYIGHGHSNAPEQATQSNGAVGNIPCGYMHCRPAEYIRVPLITIASRPHCLTVSMWALTLRCASGKYKLCPSALLWGPQALKQDTLQVPRKKLPNFADV
ncbi:hypothetical protein J3R30DRAFT_1389244 [Lentinula aciculospora]|uniref:Secreted protein n=1 Tax=Lentinula aciculospora TaxID=153920 RepID=A0A9W9AM59_9AGAR|nr:hypothetical protein J3R30DRAFT_1389244 [Lentinula aciculospora]